MHDGVIGLIDRGAYGLGGGGAGIWVNHVIFRKRGAS